MHHYTAYWLLRALFGVGAWVCVFVAFLLVSDHTLASMVSTPVHPLTLMSGVFLGAVWDSLVAAGIAGWIVYADFRGGIGVPPLSHNATPRRW